MISVGIGQERRKSVISYQTLEFEHAELDKDALQAAFACVVAADFRNVQRWPEPVPNRSRELRAEVEYDVDVDVDGIKGTMLITDRSGNVRARVESSASLQVTSI